jgi:hypothetical protein
LRQPRVSINRGNLKADAVKSYTEVTDANFELLGLLDALKDCKHIPDCTVKQAVHVLSGIIATLSDKQIDDLIRYALLYPPRTRALLGAILENQNIGLGIDKLKQSLNPLTKIKLGLKKTDLATVENWNIE